MEGGVRRFYYLRKDSLELANAVGKESEGDRIFEKGAGTFVKNIMTIKITKGDEQLEGYALLDTKGGCEDMIIARWPPTMFFLEVDKIILLENYHALTKWRSRKVAA